MPMVLRFLVALVLAVGMSSAGATLLPADTGVIKIDAAQIGMLPDPTGQMDIAEVLVKADAFSTATSPISGFRRGALWMRIDVSRAAGASTNWWLVLDQPLIDDVRLYAPQSDGSYAEEKAGLAAINDGSAAGGRLPAFFVKLTDTAPHTLFMRLSSQNSLTVSLHFATQAAHYGGELREALAFGAFFGFYALSVLCYLFFWFWTREVLTAEYLLYLLFSGISAALSTGYLFNYLFPGGSHIGSTSLALSLCGALLLGMVYGLHVLSIRMRAPRLWHVLVILVSLASATGIAAALLVPLSSALVLIEAAMVISMILLTLLAVWRSMECDRAAWAYLATFGVLHLGLSMQFLRNLGLLPANAWTAYAGYLGITLHILIMSLAIFRRYTGLRREKERAQTAALEADLRALAERHTHQEQREFMSMVSHEFRSPLAIIDVTVQNLIFSTPDNTDSRLPRYHRIQRASQRLNALMNTYLSAERMEDRGDTLSARTCDLRELVHSVVEDIDTTHPPSIKLDMRATRHDMHCDPDAIRILLTNLLENGRRHSPPDQPVTLRVDVDVDGGVELAVIDRGEGIPADELPRLFERFFRGRSAQRRPGAGLGLYLCQRIVRQHGGTIQVESELGRGTTFRVWLPVRNPGAV